MKAGNAATRIPTTGKSGSGGNANGTKDTVTPGTSERVGQRHGAYGDQARTSRSHSGPRQRSGR